MSYRSLVKNFQDFPKKDIEFKDISPILANPQAFAELINDFLHLLLCAKIWSPTIKGSHDRKKHYNQFYKCFKNLILNL